MDAQPFDAEDCVWKYRFAHELGDGPRITELRAAWAAWQGEDSLHEMAYGEPIDRQAIIDRMLKLLSIDPRPVYELEWLATIETIDGKVPDYRQWTPAT